MGYWFRDELFKDESSHYLFLKSSSSLGTEIFSSWSYRIFIILFFFSVQTSHRIIVTLTSDYFNMEVFV